MSNGGEHGDLTEPKLLLEAIFHKYHYDFRGYSMASVTRRLTQACEHFGCASLSILQDMVLHDKIRITDLLAFLTIQVSEFFRDPSYFKAMREHVVPYLKTYPSLKVWIAGCSTGEELYSFAILFKEEGILDKTIFYATDINTDALKLAEAGTYDLNRIKLFTENHQKSGGKSSLSDYYTTNYGAAVFSRDLRKQVVFSDHSLATDEVFAEMQLVSCRNVLIYFDRELQDRSIGLFSNALSRKGFLGLGAKENLRFSKHADDFTNFCQHERIYQKKAML